MSAAPPSDPAAPTEVDFYVLGGTGDERLHFACRLAEKAWRRGHAVWLHAASPDEAARVDDLLWTFRQDSFVPHALARAAAEVPVVIGADPEAPAEPDLVINLGERVPDFAARCRRVAEIVGGDEGSRVAARQRFRAYRDHGLAPRTHDV